MCVIIVMEPVGFSSNIRGRFELIVLVPIRFSEIGNRRSQNLVDLVAIDNQALTLLLLNVRDLTNFLRIAPEIAQAVWNGFRPSAFKVDFDEWLLFLLVIDMVMGKVMQHLALMIFRVP